MRNKCVYTTLKKKHREFCKNLIMLKTLPLKTYHILSKFVYLLDHVATFWK